MTQNCLVSPGIDGPQSKLLDGLRKGMNLKDLILAHQIENPVDSDRYFIPTNIIDAVVEDVVELQLKNTDRGLAKDEQKCRKYASSICKSKKRIYVLLVCFGTHMNWESIVQRLVHEDLDDTNLPLCKGRYGEKSGNQPYVLCKQEHASCTVPDHRECGVRLIYQWEQHQIQSLHRDQWSVQAPVFLRRNMEKIPHCVLPENIIMPFIENNEKKEETERGGYGEVWSVRIHPAHQNVIASTGTGEPLLAVKRLYKEIDFEQENRFLRALTMQEHPHLMSLLATYRLGTRYHFIFPFARANLRKYWDSMELPAWTAKHLLWVLYQLKGLVSALAAIHVYKPKVSQDTQNVPLELDRFTTSRTFRPPNVKWNIPTDETFGRHGDIKPENVLLIDKDNGTPSFLQIADFGLGRFHRVESRSLQDPKNITGSATYSPPELATGLVVSRAYDIWSLGCTFLEFLTWLCMGKSGLADFARERMATAITGWEDDYYYSDNGGPRKDSRSTEVRPSVTVWFTTLRKSDRCSECLLELLDIIQTQMIVIEVKDRISAEDLEKMLGIILEKAVLDTDYLMKNQGS